MGIDAIINGIFHRNWDAGVGLVDIIEIIINVIKLLLIAGGTFATMRIVISGYQYFTAFGNDALATKAKNGLTYAIVGVVVIVMAFAIVQFVMGQLVKPEMIPMDIQHFN